MSVHSLLLVDALETFGPAYELLVASRKHVTVDSVRIIERIRPFIASFTRVSRPVSPPPSQIDISKALSSLDPADGEDKVSTSADTDLTLGIVQRRNE